MDFKNFRPISLVSGLNKILAKFLANKHRRVVGQVVSEAQTASALITNEAIDALLKRKES